MSLPEKIFVVGAKGSGKTKVARELSIAIQQHFNVHASSSIIYNVVECSDEIIARFVELIMEFPGRFMTDMGRARWSAADWIKDIYAQKDEYRPALRAIGARLAKESPGLLLSETSARGRIVVGARRREEVNGFYHGKGGYGVEPWRAHAWVLVKRPNAPVQSDFDGEFFERQVCRHVVFNVGSLDGIKEQAQRLAEELVK